MTDADGVDWEKLERLRQEMTVEEIEALRARFARDPKSLSGVEVAVLYLVTREKIRAFEAKAKRSLDKGGNTPED
jgi:DNA-directed RNA polymerase sigma subunit (sigma70/sigma32)